MDAYVQVAYDEGVRNVAIIGEFTGVRVSSHEFSRDSKISSTVLRMSCTFLFFCDRDCYLFATCLHLHRQPIGQLFVYHSA